MNIFFLYKKTIMVIPSYASFIITTITNHNAMLQYSNIGNKMIFFLKKVIFLLINEKKLYVF